MRYGFKKKFAFASRAEWFDDYDGFSTGTKQSMQESALTSEYKPVDWLLSRVEFRNDWSDKNVFEKGSGAAKSQPTILFGLVAFFGPKK